MLIDTHTHLDMPEFDHDREEVILRALKQGIEYIITVGIGKAECEIALELAKTHPFIYAALGVHPHNAKDMDSEVYEYIALNSRSEKVVAIGEIGLDFYRTLSPKEDQIECFRKFLQLAKEIKKPVIIHDRNAHKEILTILEEENAWEIGGVIHCFSGDKEMAKKCIDYGFYISIPGTVTFKNANALRDVVKWLPIDRILLETDSPFLAPYPFRGKRNEPSYVRYVADRVSKIKGVSFEEIAKITSNNAKNLFRFSN